MIETDEVGQKIIEFLILNIHDECFNEWEYSFIKDLRGKQYSQLSTKQKAVITRLNDWLLGK